MINSNRVYNFCSVNMNFSFTSKISFTAFWAIEPCDGLFEWHVKWFIGIAFVETHNETKHEFVKP